MDRSPPLSISGARWWPLLAGLTLTFVVFDRVATWLGSDRGQAGLAVAAVVIVTVLVVNRVLLGEPFGRSLRMFGRPARRGLVAALCIAALMALAMPAYALTTGHRVSLSAGWTGLLPGLFAQGGVAEEALFRGYLFRHIRRGRTFWRAAMLAAGPFVAVHLILFTRLSWPIALASVLLAAIATLPLARAWELGGRTIWAPAILHTAIQGFVKIIVVEGSPDAFALTWIAVSAAAPFLVFVAGRPEPDIDIDIDIDRGDSR